jgi:hypothetical protein
VDEWREDDGKGEECDEGEEVEDLGEMEGCYVVGFIACGVLVC